MDSGLSEMSADVHKNSAILAVLVLSIALYALLLKKSKYLLM